MAMKRRVAVSAMYLSLVVMMALTGCAKNGKPTLGLDVDLYVHPTSADPLDILLQTAISKRLGDSKITQNSLIHVRVEDRTVILTGTAKADVGKEAERIAKETRLTLNDVAIVPKSPISNRIIPK